VLLEISSILGEAAAGDACSLALASSSAAAACFFAFCLCFLFFFLLLLLGDGGCGVAFTGSSLTSSISGLAGAF